MENTISIYVTNLSQFEYDGLILSGWFTLPASISDIFEKLQMTDEDVYEIEDWEAPFRLPGDQDIEDLNRMALLIEETEHYASFMYIEEMIELSIFSSLTEALERLPELIHTTTPPTDPQLSNRVYEMSDGTYIVV